MNIHLVLYGTSKVFENSGIFAELLGTLPVVFSVAPRCGSSQNLLPNRKFHAF
jgi:hypothetical protein